MRFSTDRLPQLGGDQLLQRLLNRIPEQEPDLNTTNICDGLGRSCIMAPSNQSRKL